LIPNTQLPLQLGMIIVIIITYFSYDAKQAVSILRGMRRKGRTCSEEELIGSAVFVLICAEYQRPKTFDLDRVPAPVSHLAKECTGPRVEGIDSAALNIANKQIITENPKIMGTEDHTPGCLQGAFRRVFGEASTWFAVCIKNIDCTAWFWPKPANGT
jgi:hypothetical protein